MTQILANRILIVDDHMMVRDGIYHMLKSQNINDAIVVDQASSGDEALEALKKYIYNLIIMDFQLPVKNGAIITKEIISKYPKIKVLALSNSDEMLNINQMLNNGASGYVLKNITPNELIIAINTIMSGGKYYSNEIAQKIISSKENFSIKGKSRKNKYSIELTPTQLKVLHFIGQGISNDVIAIELDVTKRTVEAHKYNIMQKLGFTTSIQLFKYASKLTR